MRLKISHTFAYTVYQAVPHTSKSPILGESLCIKRGQWAAQGGEAHADGAQLAVREGAAQPTAHACSPARGRMAENTIASGQM